MHSKRETVSKTWPIARKGNKFIVVPSHGSSEMPLLVLLRDVLKHMRTRKELKKILLEKKVLVNNKVVKKDNHALSLFDAVSLKDMGKHYRITYLENKKIGVEEISEKECGKKIAKVTGKKTMKKNKVQINLSDGRNIFYDGKISVGDSVLIDIDKKKIEKVISIQKGAEVLVIKGKHLGKKGVVEKTENERAIIKSREGEIKIKLKEMINIK